MRCLMTTVWMLGTLSFGTVAYAQPQAPLPLKRVRLYETGVGYFERSGPLGGAAGMELPVPSGHLDDALKSLVVMSKDGNTRVDGIEFSSSVSRDMARALAGLPEQSEGGLSQVQLLTSLKSAAVAISVGEDTHRGRLIDVVLPKENAAPHCVTVRKEGEERGTETCSVRRDAAVLLLTEDGAIRRFLMDDIRSVKPTDPAWRARLTSAMDALSNTDAQGARKLRVHGRGNGPVTLGYIAESPVWRSTYRLVLSNSAADDQLQGWALLHNDTDEDWKKVQVELVNGRPDSFLFPLAAPRYARRQLVTPERELSTVPQLMGRTVDNMWSGVEGLGLSGTGSGGGGYGQSSGLGRIGTLGHGGGAGSGSAHSALLAVGNLANLADAEGVESGALFRYKLPKNVNLRAHGSALLPFVNISVRSVQATYFEHSGQEGRSAVHFTNRTRQTMPAGPISIFADGGFAGETALPRTKPGEQRILRFGFDQDTEINRATSRSTDTTRHLRFHDGQLEEHYLRSHFINYELVNRSGAARRLYLVLKVSSKGDVRGADDLIMDELTGRALAVFNIKAASRKMQELTLREGLMRTHALSTLGPKKLRHLAAAPKLLARERDILQSVAVLLQDVQKHFDNARKQRQQHIQTKAEVARLRTSVRALGRHAKDEGEALVERLVAAELRITTLQDSIRREDGRGNSVRKKAAKLLTTLNARKPVAAARK